MSTFRTLARWTGRIGFILIAVLGAAWSATALSFHAPAPWLWLAWGALALLAAAALREGFRAPLRGWLLAVIGGLAVFGWYSTIRPAQDRAWAPDVAHGITYTRDGDIVTVHNVRNFAWTNATDATPVWETRTYDLATLTTVDMVTSVWDSPEIAHLIVSFGFDDGRHLAFSVEIRKEAHEVYSTLGGFFRTFELALIAADEGDVMRLRTNLRQEDVHLYPVNLDPARARALFLTYLDLGNRLAAEPQFYNTVTANCTSVVYRLVRAIKPDMPLDLSLVLSGRLPQYLDGLGGLVGDMPMDQRRAAAAITARGQALPPGADFSAWIRQ